MAKRVNIFKKDGTPTPFFWSEKDGADRTQQTVYKRTDTGITRMRGVHFDATKNEMVKE
ncbi:MAG TPA: hypothetical protein VF039_01215 [Longimicrobiales bacterium]